MKNKGFLIAGVCAALTVALLILNCAVDVAPVGPEGTNVGLSRLNQAFSGLVGFNNFWYQITELLGIAALLAAALFAAVGLVQLVRRKSLRKVDGELLALGGLYLAVVCLYTFFEVVVVNRRPVVMPGEAYPEASFPSSHTMLICVVMGSAMMLMGKYVRSAGLCRALRALCGLIIVVAVVGRLLSGVHWLTDILGGVLISAALLALYAGVLERLRRAESPEGAR